MMSHWCQHLLLACNSFQLLQLSLHIPVALQPDNCGPTYIIIGDGGNEEGVEDDFTQPQAAWSAYRDLAFGQASFVILNETTASWIWSADDGTPLDAVSGLHASLLSVRCDIWQTGTASLSSVNALGSAKKVYA